MTTARQLFDAVLDECQGRTTMNQSPYLLRAAEIESSTQSISHPWNAHSEIRGTMLARTLGLTRTGVSLARIRSGKESFVYHSHRYEEEWIYIPRMGKRMIRDGADVQIYDVADAKPMGPLDD